jgi:hypothetical protein
LIVTISFRAKNEQLANHLSVFSSGDFRSLLKDQTAIPDDLKICVNLRNLRITTSNNL